MIVYVAVIKPFQNELSYFAHEEEKIEKLFYIKIFLDFVFYVEN